MNCDPLGKLRSWCEVCGAHVHHPPRGRPRRYCSEPCRKAACNARRREGYRLVAEVRAREGLL